MAHGGPDEKFSGQRDPIEGRKSDELERAERSQAFSRRGENATAKVKGFGASLRFTAVAAACSLMRLQGFDAGREPCASRYLFSREPSQNFANFFSEIDVIVTLTAGVLSLADPRCHY